MYRRVAARATVHSVRLRIGSAALVGTLLFAALPAEAQLPPRKVKYPYDEDRPVPPGYHVETDVPYGPILGGAGMVIAPYTIGIIIAADYQFDDSGGWLFLPVAGPPVYLATRKGCSGNEGDFEDSVCGFGEAMLTVVVVIDTLVQVGGIALLTVGLVSIEDVVVRDDRGEVTWTVLPTPIGDHGAGLTAVGRF